MPVQNENVGIAFALVAAAALSTSLGAAVVFFPSIIKLASRRVLAGALGFSAGVMCYVSYIEIFQKSITAFQDAVGDHGHAFAFATLSFFGGFGIMLLLNVVVSFLLEGHSHRQETAAAVATAVGTSPSDNEVSTDQKPTRKDVDELSEEMICTPPYCTKDPVAQLDAVQKMTSVLQDEEQECNDGQGVVFSAESHDDFVDTLPLPDKKPSSEEDQTDPVTVDDIEQTSMPVMEEDDRVSRENKRLAKMGMTTALAVALHNFPEGLATFVAALHDPKVGAVLAIAIAIHNIPEGLCIAPPIYYATGNRTKAFLWALLSGAAELVAAFLGWLVLSNVVTDATYGTLFGIVAGMMVIISIRELLPTAHFYDPEDTIVTYAFIGGSMFMALSLVLFVI